MVHRLKHTLVNKYSEKRRLQNKKIWILNTLANFLLRTRALHTCTYIHSGLPIHRNFAFHLCRLTEQVIIILKWETNGPWNDMFLKTNYEHWTPVMDYTHYASVSQQGSITVHLPHRITLLFHTYTPIWHVLCVW